MEYGYHSQEGGGTHLSIPSHVHGHSSKVTRSPVQLLEEVCLKNHWGIPIYSLHTAATCSSQGEGPLYYYKVCHRIRHNKLMTVVHTFVLCGGIAKKMAAPYLQCIINYDLLEKSIF